MHETVKNLLKIKENVKVNLTKDLKSHNLPQVIAVSKTFKINHIMPLIEHGHTDFGENKVQEAFEKWTSIKNKNKNIKLHLIGKLQSNKVNIERKIFIQVNIGREEQKSGIPEDELYEFYQYCKCAGLNIIGLMCIPPFNEDSTNYFKRMNELNKKLGLKELSMGMSSDYLNAISNGSTFVRIGSQIFGQRE